jgi:anhydro-N-acetylmuramic acid kinase
VAEYDVIGLMSGSSLDGLDICRILFKESDNQWKYKVIDAHCYVYDESFRRELQQVSAGTAIQLAALHTRLGHVFSSFVLDFLSRQADTSGIQLLVSHGQTVFHQPEHGFTTQIGCGATLAAKTGLTVVNDLRTVDVALGGQGAPLVPLGEQYLFPGQGQFLNIGGICNVSLHEDRKVIAYDVCPGNTLLNFLARKMGQSYDEGGRYAKSGELSEGLLSQLNSIPFYRQQGPKSLGTEHLLQDWVPIIEAARLSPEHALRTVTEHIAMQIAVSLGEGEVLVTGGGAFNDFLIQRIEALSPCRVIIPDACTVAYKEAIIMGFLGLLRILHQPNALASVTGASRNSVGGAIYFAG